MPALWLTAGVDESPVNAGYRINFPEYFDDYATEIEAKGYFDDLTVEAGATRYKPLFYDTVRVRQEYEDHLASGAAAFAERNLVVLPKVIRATIEAAIDELARTDFRALTQEIE
jgi:hypothetical protein